MPRLLEGDEVTSLNEAETAFETMRDEIMEDVMAKKGAALEQAIADSDKSASNCTSGAESEIARAPYWVLRKKGRLLEPGILTLGRCDGMYIIGKRRLDWWSIGDYSRKQIEAKRFVSPKEAHDFGRQHGANDFRIVRVRPTASALRGAIAQRDGAHRALHKAMRELTEVRAAHEKTKAELRRATHDLLDSQTEVEARLRTDRDAWKKKYEDLETSRATCCVQLEADVDRLRTELVQSKAGFLSLSKKWAELTSELAKERAFRARVMGPTS